MQTNDTDQNGLSEEAQPRKRFKRSSQACLNCRHLKMKCTGSVPCERCVRQGRHCEELERPMRGSWSRKKDMEIQTLTKRLEEMEQKLGTSQVANHVPQLVASHSPAPKLAPHAGASSSSSSLVPSGSLPPSEVSLSELPFIKSGIVSIEEAKDLHHSFMQSCIQHVPVLDAEWQSFSRSTSVCPFLFACIINVAANYSDTRPLLRSEMQEEMNALVGSTITSGRKSVSIIQAFLLLYFWNQPSADLELDLAWTYSGLAMRMAVDLNLQNAKGEEDERERINRERTWMFCFLVDRTCSAARGRKWSLHGNDGIISNTLSWYSQDICRSWDLGISALADLLKVTSRQSDVLNDCLLTASELGNSNFQCDTTMRVLNEELQQWKKRWYARGFFTSPLGEDLWIDSPVNAVTGGTDVHARTLHYLTRQAFLRFYYAVLVLNCAGLQYYANHPENAEGRAYILINAMQAAQGVVTAAKDGLRYTVAYSPQTQCTIISFAIVSLIKMAPLMRDDTVTSDRLIQLATSGITFLESVALKPTHVPARCASMLRGLLRKSSQQNEGSAAFRLGMEQHSLPPRSSRAVTPSREEFKSGKAQTGINPFTNSTPSQTMSGDVIEDLDLLSNHTPTSFSLFGADGSTGLGTMTAEQILDESFWLCLAPFTPSAPGC